MAYAACKSRSGLRALFLAFDRVCYEDGIMPYEGSLRKWVQVSTSLAFVITACSVSLDAYGIYGSQDGSQDVQQLFETYIFQG